MCKTVLTSYKTRLFSVHNALWKTCGKHVISADNSFESDFSTSIHSRSSPKPEDKWKNNIQITEKKQLMLNAGTFVMWKTSQTFQS